MASLVDDAGRIQVPGFYDDVVPLTKRERQQFAALPFDESAFMEKIGVTGVTGERGYTTLERRWARPTCDINGIWGGYQGGGAKTVLPAKAGVKFSFRLVPDQDPAKIQQALREHLESLCPPGIQMELIDMHSARGIVVPLDSPYMAGGHAGHRAGLRSAPRVHSRRRLDPDRQLVPRRAGRRHAVARLGTGRRQRTQPQREVQPGGFPSGHQNQCAFVERAEQDRRG